MVSKWQTKVKRATTALKKWQRRQQYYTRLANAEHIQGNTGRLIPCRLPYNSQIPLEVSVQLRHN